VAERDRLPVAPHEIVVFAGPTIAPADVRAALACRVEPPAQLGSILRVMSDTPKVLAIVDGYYESVPAVWHREILWALRHGVWVYGAASMGALRAAELDAFGMRGVGGIYGAYRDGELTDDDDVAVAHGPAASGHRTVSEAMVNVRATLSAAVARGVVPAETATEIARVAKARFYAERDWPTIVADARRAGISPAAVGALETDLASHGPVDQKRRDAIEMLEVIARDVEGGWTPAAPTFEWEDTSAWELLVRTESGPPPAR
jgi:hypothetical protein